MPHTSYGALSEIRLRYPSRRFLVEKTLVIKKLVFYIYSGSAVESFYWTATTSISTVLTPREKKCNEWRRDVSTWAEDIWCRKAVVAEIFRSTRVSVETIDVTAEPRIWEVAQWLLDQKTYILHHKVVLKKCGRRIMQHFWERSHNKMINCYQSRRIRCLRWMEGK